MEIKWAKSILFFESANLSYAHTEEARVYQLRCGALELFHHGLLPVPLHEVEQMDFIHLVDVLSRCPYK